MHKPLTGLVAGSVLCLVASDARAQDENPGGFLLPGVLWSVSPARTLGAEISYAHYPNHCCWGFGPKIDAEWLQPRGPWGGTYRGSLGAEAFIGGLGIEASLSRQGARDLGPRAGFGGSFGAFASLGFGSIGVRHTRAFDQGDPPVTALVFTAKWMILVYGENPYRLASTWSNWGRMPSGRPLLVSAAPGDAPQPVVAALGRTDGWSGTASSPRGRRGRSLRDRLIGALTDP